ncbi:MAG: hypothetical protein ACT4OZ_00775 [Gemmatimonadota bacterium]
MNQEPLDAAPGSANEHLLRDVGTVVAALGGTSPAVTPAAPTPAASHYFEVPRQIIAEHTRQFVGR